MTMVGEICTTHPATVSRTDKVKDAADLMAEHDIGDVLVVDADEPVGILTDRDIAIRVVAEGRDPARTQVSTVCSQGVVTVPTGESVDGTAELMRQHAIRRLPVVRDDGTLAGVVSLGDLAMSEDRESALADISRAPANA